VHWRASLEGTPLNLTRREFGLLQVLSRHPGRIFSRARLLELAYDDTVDVTERAIDSHVKNLRRKLGAVSPSHDWIRSVYGVGFAWEAPPQA
jgi:two-component system response regulator BaeR